MPKASTLVGMPDPSVVNCEKLGYETKVVTEKNRGKKGICIFPDGNECTTWDFYRGLCGQKWSYCVQQGYTIKPAGIYEGWIEGAKCTKEGKEVGSVYQLFSLHEGGCQLTK